MTEPRFMTPQHDYSKRPLQLFWLDGLALQAIAESDEETMLLTQVNDDGNEGTADTGSSSSSSSIYPLRPPVEAIATFKTTPSIHAGYAATWFGLSAAGMYMTRKLISKGRF
jgi:surfeit locus 1 family protein